MEVMISSITREINSMYYDGKEEIFPVELAKVRSVVKTKNIKTEAEIEMDIEGLTINQIEEKIKKIMIEEFKEENKKEYFETNNKVGTNPAPKSKSPGIPGSNTR